MKLNSIFNKPKRKDKYSKDFIKNKDKVKSYFVIEQSSINEILLNTPILTVISDYIILKKRGSSYVGRCPFCKTLTYNNKHFVVTPKKLICKCFECGVAMKTPTTFLMKYYNEPFDKILNFINKTYHNNKYQINTKGKVVNKGNFIDEDLPF